MGLDLYIKFDIIRMEFDVRYYTDQNGRKPVQDFLEEVFDKNYALWSECIASIGKIKHRIYHKEPFSKALGFGLFEIRVRSKNDIARIIYGFVKGRQIILLHGFIKKTEKIPLREIEIAQNRLKNLPKE